MIYFTSDQHFGHRNIIGYCARPFADVDEMNEALVSRFNATVGPDDTTYHLGDFALDERLVARFLPRLSGRHHLVMGNHDTCYPGRRKAERALRLYLAAGFQSVDERLHLDLPGLGSVLTMNREGSVSSPRASAPAPRPSVRQRSPAPPASQRAVVPRRDACSA